MSDPESLPDRALGFLRGREQEELAKAKKAFSSENRIGHLALARAYARQINRQNISPDPVETGPDQPEDDPPDGR
jgi:hypothetical protein